MAACACHHLILQTAGSGSTSTNTGSTSSGSGTSDHLADSFGQTNFTTHFGANKEVGKLQISRDR